MANAETYTVKDVTSLSTVSTLAGTENLLISTDEDINSISANNLKNYIASEKMNKVNPEGTGLFTFSGDGILLGNGQAATNTVSGDSICVGFANSSASSYSLALGSFCSAIDSSIAIGHAGYAANRSLCVSLGMGSTATSGSAAIGGGSANNLSLAVGFSAHAQDFSLAVGHSCSAQGYSLCSGYINTAVDHSFACGGGCIANASYSIAVGRGSQALSRCGVAMGETCVVNGIGGVALGHANTSGIDAFSYGESNGAKGPYSFAGGYESDAEGSYSFALGNHAHTAQASSHSVAIGQYVSTTEAFEVTFGYNNVPGYAFSIGRDGNILQLDEDGNFTVKGDIYTNGSTSNALPQFVKLTETEYSSLEEKNANTFYIVGSGSTARMYYGEVQIING